MVPGEYFLLHCISSWKHVVSTHYKCLTEALLMSSSNIRFCGEIRKKYQYFWVENKKTTTKNTLSVAIFEYMRTV